MVKKRETTSESAVQVAAKSIPALNDPNLSFAAEGISYFIDGQTLEELQLPESLQMYEYYQGVMLSLNKTVERLFLEISANPNHDGARRAAVSAPSLLMADLDKIVKPEMVPPRFEHAHRTFLESMDKVIKGIAKLSVRIFEATYESAENRAHRLSQERLKNRPSGGSALTAQFNKLYSEVAGRGKEPEPAEKLEELIISETFPRQGDALRRLKSSDLYKVERTASHVVAHILIAAQGLRDLFYKVFNQAQSRLGIEDGLFIPTLSNRFPDYISPQDLNYLNELSEMEWQNHDSKSAVEAVNARLKSVFRQP